MNFPISTVTCFSSNNFQPSLSVFLKSGLIFAIQILSILYLWKHMGETWLLILGREENTAYLVFHWKWKWSFSRWTYNWKVFLHVIYFTYQLEKQQENSEINFKWFKMRMTSQLQCSLCLFPKRSLLNVQFYILSQSLPQYLSLGRKLYHIGHKLDGYQHCMSDFNYG